MEPLFGRTVSQIKNRYYQNLKDKNLDQIKYKQDKKRKREPATQVKEAPETNKRKLKAKKKLDAIKIRLSEDHSYSANKHCFSTKENSPFIQHPIQMS
jgi:DNA-nicking Smr family endonuclease